MQRKVERARTVLHGVGPLLNKPDIAIREFPNRKLSSKRSMIKQLKHKDRGHPFSVVQPEALDVQRPCQPIRGIHESVCAMVWRCAVNRCEIATETERVAEYSGIFGNMRMEITWAFRETAGIRLPSSTNIFEIEMPIVSIPIVFNNVGIDVDPVRSHYGDAAFKTLAAAVSGRNGVFLSLRSQIVIVKNVVSARKTPGSSFQWAGNPDGRKSCVTKCIRLCCQVIPPEGNRFVAVQW